MYRTPVDKPIGFEMELAPTDDAVFSYVQIPLEGPISSLQGLFVANTASPLDYSPKY